MKYICEFNIYLKFFVLFRLLKCGLFVACYLSYFFFTKTHLRRHKEGLERREEKKKYQLERNIKNKLKLDKKSFSLMKIGNEELFFRLLIYP